MEELYTLFPEQYEKTLKLIKKYDVDLYNKASKRIFSLPGFVVEKIRRGNEFEFSCDDYKTYFETFQNTLEFQHTKYNRYYNMNITVNAYTEYELENDGCDEESEAIKEELKDMDWEEFFTEHPELEDEDLTKKSILLFSLTTSNVDKIPETHFHYMEKDGESFLYNITLHGAEFDYAVFLENVDNNYVLVKETRLNDMLISKKEEEISYEELLDYVVDDDFVENFDDEDLF